MSTCSPICGIRARMTEAAAPNFRRSKPPPLGFSSPGKAVHCETACGSAHRMKPIGRRFSPIQSGCVASWKREMRVTPCVTSGMMTKAETT